MPEVVQREQPVLALRRAAICLHFLEARRTEEETGYPGCPVLTSVEMDLLSYRFQERPPIGSQCETYAARPVEILFPEQVSYGSEGRRIQLCCESPSRSAAAVVTSTTFLRSGLKVWHLALMPADGVVFFEYDLIKLIHIYDGRAERTEMREAIQFRLPGSSAVDVCGLLRALCPEASPHAQPCGGTVQLLIGELREGNTPHAALLETARDAGQKDDEALQRLTAWIDARGNKQRVLSAYCGIVTGILDFGFLDVDEVTDSLSATVPEAPGLLRLHRNTLSSIVEDDRIFAECRKSVGISPYLIIPHAAIIHNEAVTDAADSVIDGALALQKPHPCALEQAHDEAKRNLLRLYLPNLFNYETERLLFRNGLEARGSVDKHGATQAKLADLQSRINSTWEARKDRGQMAVAVLLALISVLQMRDIVFDAAGRSAPVSVRWAILILLALLVSLLIIGFWRQGMRPHAPPALTRRDRR